VFRHIWLVLLLAAASSASPANPPRLSYATYVGPAAGSVVYGLAVDAAGYAPIIHSYSTQPTMQASQMTCGHNLPKKPPFKPGC
jgi:hypothetical protein